MAPARRRFLVQSGALVVAVADGACRPRDQDGGHPQTPSLVAARSIRRVTRLLAGVPSVDGAGVRLTRVIGQPDLRHLDPFILLDRFHSSVPSDFVRGFPSHPHRGFETVTIMLAGRVRHEDSRGNRGLITGGGAQWMTAGRGIVHAEMPEAPPGGLMSGFQLWINLPASEKMCAQAYQDLAPSQLKEDRQNPSGTTLRVIAGEGGPVRPRPTSPTLATLALEDDHPFEIDTPKGHNAFVFVAGGAVAIGPDGGETVATGSTIAVLSRGDRLRVRAVEQRSHLLIAAAAPLNEPIVQRGPFVMNTEQEIQRAWDDYRAGVLDKG